MLTFQDVTALMVCFSVMVLLLLVVVVWLWIDKRKNKKAINRLMEMAKESEQLKQAFITNMTHEVRTPLNAIVGFSSVLAAAEGLSLEERMQFIKEIEENKEQLLKLVDDMMDFSSIESNTLEYNDSDVDINVLLQELCMRENMTPRDNNVKVEFTEKLPQCRFKVDRKRFLQVVENLVLNALKFTDEGAVKLGYKRLSNGKFYFFVADTGCGIDEHARFAIFDSFVKMNQNVKGAGLGLSIAKSIVTHYGGGIGVESRKGEGSTFYFTLPASIEFKEYGKF